MLAKLDQLIELVEYYVWRLKKAAYQLIRSVYRKLPPGISGTLQGARFRFVRWSKRRALLASSVKFHKSSNVADISWDEFSARILSRRAVFKGIFVQENSVDWSIKLYQRPQHICSALGRAGYLVIYKIDNWSDDDVNGFREVSENVWITNRPEVDMIDGVIRSFYSTSYQLSPELLMANGKRGLMVYEYIDHIDAHISGDSIAVNQLLKLKNFAFNGGADFIIASAKELEREAVNAIGREKVFMVPNGADTAHYRAPVHLLTEINKRYSAFTEKFSNIVGYFGAIAPWLWYDVITQLVKSRPDLGFVFIGPDYNGAARSLGKSDNLIYLGEVDYQILPAYARLFDVCFIPFAPGDIARATSPLKLFEYFALEKPVVVTSDMFECVAFEEVFSGDSAKALSEAIDQAIGVKLNPEYKLRLRQLAIDNDWTERAKAMEVIFDCLPKPAPKSRVEG